MRRLIAWIFRSFRSPVPTGRYVEIDAFGVRQRIPIHGRDERALFSNVLRGP